MSLISRQVFNVSCIVSQYRVYCVRLFGNSFFNDFKRYQFFVPHFLILTIPFLTALMPRVSSNSLCFWNVHIHSRFLYRYSRERNTTAGQYAVVLEVWKEHLLTVTCNNNLLSFYNKGSQFVILLKVIVCYKRFKGRFRHQIVK